MNVTIDSFAGFCFGVVYAIQMAEEELESASELFCLGDIVHNSIEVERLKNKKLIVINHEEFKILTNCKVLIRAHGEPPDTYKIAVENNIELIDASCPVVLKLQNRIRNGFSQSQTNNGQIVIYGKEGHAEVNGLVGQTFGKAIIVNSYKDLDKIDYTRPIFFYSQTTQSPEGFNTMKDEIKRRVEAHDSSHQLFLFDNDTICRQVSNREPQLKKFATIHDVVIFVSDKKSSNGMFLFDVCKKNNPKTYLLSEKTELKTEWFKNVNSVGITGATSTPLWLMEEVRAEIAKW